VPFATYLDFTDDSTVSSLSLITNGFGGTVDGVGFTLTSTDGVNFNEGYDGSGPSTNPGCQANGGPLKCDNDGAGISDDEMKYRTTEVSTQNVPLAGIQVL
jgi:hypothetical protein